MGRKKKKINKNITIKQVLVSVLVFLIVISLEFVLEKIDEKLNTPFGKISYSNLVDVPDYSGDICVMINNNKPYFTKEDYKTEAFENYSQLDYLGRCGVAYANICKETMPEKGDQRGDISMVHPTGWRQTKFNGEFIYNRCHLIAYCLSDEDANDKNLITGTRYFNVEGMLPIEKLVLEYMNQNQNNHVLYRVTPVFKEKNLLASGVEMEGYSIEDNGRLSFNVFVYNVQPDAKLNYETGELISN